MTSEDNCSAPAKIATGAAVGLVAGFVASFAMDRFQSLTQPSSDGDGEPATHKAADCIARDATGGPLSDDAKPLGGQPIHHRLGAALGVGYGIAAGFSPTVTRGAGTVFATGTWALLDETAVPAAGLGDPPWKASPETQAYSLASHVVIGLAAAGSRRFALRVAARLGNQPRGETTSPPPQP